MEESRMRRIVVLALLSAVSITAHLAAQTSLNAVYMTVNDEPIYAWEIKFTLPQIQAEMSQRGLQPTRSDLLRAVVNRSVEVRLLAQEARRLGLEPDSARVEADLARIEEESGGRARLDALLSGLGGTYDQLRDKIAESDIVQVLLAARFEPRVTVTPQEVATYYDENPDKFEKPPMVRARHILIRLPRQADQATKDSARARADAAHRSVTSGEDFAAVARKVSEEPAASKGGDLGFFTRDSMVPTLTDVAFALDVGEVSDVIETQFGYHILKVEEKRAAGKMTYAEARGPLEEIIKENKTGELVAERLEELRKDAKIVFIDPPAGETAGTGG
jgi:peptidyl-prolyl cis-trans isomerase C